MTSIKENCDWHIYRLYRKFAFRKIIEICSIKEDVFTSEMDDKWRIELW